MTSSDLALVAVAGWGAFSVLVVGLDRLAAGPGRRPRWIRFLVNDRGERWEPVPGHRGVEPGWTLAGSYDPGDWAALVSLDREGAIVLADEVPQADEGDGDAEPGASGPHLVLIPGLLGTGVAGDDEYEEELYDDWADDDWADDDWADDELADDDGADDEGAAESDHGGAAESTDSGESTDADESADDRDGSTTALAAPDGPSGLEIELAIDLTVAEPAPVSFPIERADPFFADLIRRLSDRVAFEVRARAATDGPRPDLSAGEPQPTTEPEDEHG